MSTRQQRSDARENRERIVEAARRLFAVQGAAVPLDAIAAEAQLGPGTLHRHFPTKAALLAAVVESAVRERVADAVRAADDPDPGRALFGVLDRLLVEGRRSLAFKQALADKGVEAAAAAPGETAALRSALASLLRAAQLQGSVRGDLRIADLMALLAGLVAAQQQPGLSAAGAARLRAVLRQGLAP